MFAPGPSVRARTDKPHSSSAGPNASPGGSYESGPNPVTISQEQDRITVVHERNANPFCAVVTVKPQERRAISGVYSEFAPPDSARIGKDQHRSDLSGRSGPLFGCPADACPPRFIDQFKSGRTNRAEWFPMVAPCM